MNPVKEIQDLVGWGALDLGGEAHQAQRDKAEAEGRALASLFHRAFRQSEAGAQVLDHLITVTLMRPTVKPNDTQFQAGIREGRADIVRQILQQLEFAETQK